jgi:acetoin utilization deacetylase AcuC-like enzyme
VIEAVDMVMKGTCRTRSARCVRRVTIALPDRAMGFCVFNNVAVGAAHAREVHGVARVAVIDFDVHHGNGTEAMFFSDPRCSTDRRINGRSIPAQDDPANAGPSTSLIFRCPQAPAAPNSARPSPMRCFPR